MFSLQRYVLRRLIMAIPVVAGVIVFTFSMLQLTPGDPAVIIAGPNAPAAVVEEIRRSLGLDQPLHVQFLRYITRLFQGDLGQSIISKRDVTAELGRLLPNTIELVVVSMAISTAIGIPLGIWAATRRGSYIDSLVMSVSLMGLTMPVFFIGLGLVWLFGFELRWLPISGRGGPLWTAQGWRHIILPAVTLAFVQAGALARITRSTMLEVLGADFIRTAHAKGVAPRTVVFKHALKNAALPVITVLGLQFGTLLSGAVVTETVFAWPGMGRMMIQAIMQKDIPIVQGAVLLFAVSFVIINLLVDLLYAYLDPRIRYE